MQQCYIRYNSSHSSRREEERELSTGKDSVAAVRSLHEAAAPVTVAAAAAVSNIQL